MQESSLLRHIADRSQDLHGLAGAFGRVVTGPGDDCAVVESSSGDLLCIGVDQLVVGRHVEPTLADSADGVDAIARKAVARAVSDIAAMGARPAWGLATGLLPSSFEHADGLFDAMATWARHWQCPLIGGDIASGHPDTPLSLTVTIAGVFDPGSKPILRAGAHPGHALYLTGKIGGSLPSGRHLSFEPRIKAGRDAARPGSGVHAAIDLSDGLGRDADRIATASGVRIEIHANDVPIHPEANGWGAAASDGEDYELLLAIDPAEGEAFIRTHGLLGPIGTVTSADGSPPGAVFIDEHGKAHNAAAMGWDHQ